MISHPPEPGSLLRLAAAFALVALGGLQACSSSDQGSASGEPSAGFTGEMPLLEELGSSRPPGGKAVVDPADWRLPETAGEESTAAWLPLLYSQDNRAELEACGCPGSPTGGMARRAEYVRRLREIQPDLLLVEGPTALSRTVLGFENVSGKDRARGLMVLRTLAKSEPAAFFPGQADFAVLPPPELAQEAAKLDLPLVATNLAAESAGESYLRFLHRDVEGRSVVLLGLIGSPGTQERSSRTQLDDAVASVERAVTEATRLHGPPSIVIAFTDGALRDVGAWRAAGLDVDVLLTGPVQGDSRIHHRDSAWLSVRADPLGRAFRRLDILVGERDPTEAEARGVGSLSRVAALEAQYLHDLWVLRDLESQVARGENPRREVEGMDGVARTDPRTDPAQIRRGLAELKALRRQSIGAFGATAQHRYSVATVVMEPAVPEDPDVVKVLDHFGARRLARLRVEQGEVEQTPRDERYAGRGSCTECHAPLDAHWTRTAHALAWKSLVDRGEELNPDCLPCHTTGFAQPGGFVDPVGDRSLLNVQCEACHGPMLVHSQQVAGSRVRPDAGLRVTEAACRRCHDAANSPRFDFQSYLPRVLHPGLARPRGTDE